MTFMNSKPPRVTFTMVSAAGDIALFSTCLAVAELRTPSVTNFTFPATRSRVISLSIGASFFIFSNILSETMVGTALLASAAA